MPRGLLSHRIGSDVPFFLPFLLFLPKKDRQEDAPNHDAPYRLGVQNKRKISC